MERRDFLVGAGAVAATAVLPGADAVASGLAGPVPDAAASMHEAGGWISAGFYRRADDAVFPIEDRVNGDRGGGRVDPVTSSENVEAMRRRPTMYLKSVSDGEALHVAPDAVDDWVAIALLPERFSSRGIVRPGAPCAVDIASDGRISVVDRVATDRRTGESAETFDSERLAAFGCEFAGIVESDGTRRLSFRADPRWFSRVEPDAHAVFERMRVEPLGGWSWGLRIDLSRDGRSIGTLVYDQPVEMSGPGAWHHRDDVVPRLVA